MLLFFKVISLAFVPAGSQKSVEGLFECGYVLDEASRAGGAPGI